VSFWFLYPFFTGKGNEQCMPVRKKYCIQKNGVIEARPTNGITEKQNKSYRGIKMLHWVQKKRFVIPLLASFLFGMFFPVASFAEGSKSITILYTGSVRGNIEPIQT
jgi:hypothetical protein